MLTQNNEASIIQILQSLDHSDKTDTILFQQKLELNIELNWSWINWLIEIIRAARSRETIKRVL